MSYSGPIRIDLVGSNGSDTTELELAEFVRTYEAFSEASQVGTLVERGEAVEAALTPAVMLRIDEDIVVGEGPDAMPPVIVVSFEQATTERNNKASWDAARGGDVLYYTQFLDVVLIGEHHDALGYALVQSKNGSGWIQKVGDGPNASVEIQFIGEERYLRAMIRETFKSSRRVVTPG